MICVPLNNIHEIIGCVQIINKNDNSLFDENDLTLCEQMAALSAITIEEYDVSVDEKGHTRLEKINFHCQYSCNRNLGAILVVPLGIKISQHTVEK
ncbi:MAG: hypothetical protein IJJ79_07030 [Lachnospiraceae bacterium]|nr:hypothetical protein [Lachnospiraceae bacterium]